MPGGRQRPRSRRRLDHDGGMAEGGNQTVPSQEAPLLHVGAIGHLGEQAAGPGDALEQIVIGGRVRLIEADRKDDDRLPSPIERSFMGRAIDTDRTPGDDHEPLKGKPPCETMGEVERLIIG